jgi:hypothetical protein
MEYSTNLTKTPTSPVDTTNQCREQCIPNLGVHEIYLENSAQEIRTLINNFITRDDEVKTNQNYWSPKCNDNTNVAASCTININKNAKTNPKWIENEEEDIYTMREKLVPFECSYWFSHYIFGWLYQRPDLQQHDVTI